MTKLEKELRRREERRINSINKAESDLAEDALRVLWNVVLIMIGVVIGLLISASRSQAAEIVSIPPRCVYVGALPTEAQNAAQPPTGVNETPLASMPDAEMVETIGTRWERLGRWKLTFYCDCRTCSGKWGRRTSSGATCQEGVTVACAILPPGTIIKIDGYGERIVQDTGAGVSGKHLDVFMESHSECLRHGIQYREVWVKR